MLSQKHVCYNLCAPPALLLYCGIIMIVVGPLYQAKVGKMSSGYELAVCTAESTGGSVAQYCGGFKECRCKMNCCNYAVMVTVLKGPSVTSVNDTILKRFCLSKALCLEHWMSFYSLANPPPPLQILQCHFLANTMLGRAPKLFFALVMTTAHAALPCSANSMNW